VKNLRRWTARAVRGVDRYIRSHRARRHVLIYARNAMHVAVMDPVAAVLERDPRITVRYLAETPAQEAHIDSATGRPRRWLRVAEAARRRIDLFVSADPWNCPTLYRCYGRMNFFHGVAGKYDLDDPSHLSIDFDQWDRVAFINTDRMQRYARLGILKPGAAVLVGFPKLDALVNGRIDAGHVCARLGLDRSRRTALYAPTWSPASSLNMAGETIVGSLVAAAFNVIIKPHDLSFDFRSEKYSGGIDWRERLRAIERPGQVVVAQNADSSPLMAASDVLVTDHSSIGFEFCLLDRPIVIIDAPDLPRVARINPERIALLRAVAPLVHDPSAIGRAAAEALANPHERAAERAALGRASFFEPGTATERATAVAYDLLKLDLPHARATSAHRHSVEASA
jgi:CDP-glycerol:poly(glycerophosphate) glycerophosphotransferase